MKETWKDINNYEGYYQISNLGRVRNIKYNRFLTNHLNHKGYNRTCLCKNSKQKVMRIHRLVAEAFIPNPESKQEVNHKDFDKTNNKVSNLEWVTGKENIRHYQDFVNIFMGLLINNPHLVE